MTEIMVKRLLLAFCLLTTAGLGACASKEETPPTEGQSQNEKAVEPSAALREQAENALIEPGTEHGWGESSLAGVEKWSLHTGRGVTIIGKNTRGLIEVGITVTYDRPNHTSALACATAGTITCEDAVNAILRDFKAGGAAMGGPTVRPKFWPFGESEEARNNRCADGLVGLVEATPSWAPVTEFRCQEGDALELKLRARGWDEGQNPCFSVSGAFIAEGAPDLADACCNGQTGRSDIVDNNEEGRLVDTGFDLVCM